MAGIYVHIPFCKQACSYCDFHFSTNLKLIDKITEAICNEVILRKDFFNQSTHQNKPLNSLYFGGGTPSILPIKNLEKIILCIEKNFEFTSSPEITLEANPDDLTQQKLMELKRTPVNRFSIGVQSFIERDLILMHRAHKAAQAEDAIKRAQDIGFENLSIDLIYGTPKLTDNELKYNLTKATQLSIQHLSCYSLTVENKTLLTHLIERKKINSPTEHQSANQFQLVMDYLETNGYNHYEISNWGKPGYEAVHNSSYWKGEAYLGLGPSAHSFNGKNKRSYNIKNNPQYIKQLVEKNYTPFIEELSINEQYNEAVLIGLRVISGVNSKTIENKFGYDYAQFFIKNIATSVAAQWVEKSGDTYSLTKPGKFFADKIASDCLIV